MADARTLLRAKRQESSARISHPYASYTSTGALRCLACGVPIKSAAMWEGHIGSKTHRVAVRNLKAKEEQEEKEREIKRNGKRKAEDGDGMDDEMDVDTAEENVNGAVPTNAKKRRTSNEPEHTSPPPRKTKGFPADFFSDPSQAPILSTADDEEDEDEGPAPTTQPKSNAPSDKPKSQIDLEWEQFQASLLNPSAAVEEQEDERRAAFERATVVAEPELVPNAAEGFPPAVTGEAEQLEENKEETEEEKQKRKAQEERELIMDRLIEEERTQEEADERVSLLRARVEALKKAREAKRKAK